MRRWNTIAAIGGAAANSLNYMATEVINDRPIDVGSLKRVPGKLWDNMKKSWVETVYAGTTRRVAGRVVRKTAKAVLRRKAANIAAEVGMSTVVAVGAVVGSKWKQRILLPQ